MCHDCKGRTSTKQPAEAWLRLRGAALPRRSRRAVAMTGARLGLDAAKKEHLRKEMERERAERAQLKSQV